MAKIRCPIPCSREFDVVEPAVWTADYTPCQTCALAGARRFRRREIELGLLESIWQRLSFADDDLERRNQEYCRGRRYSAAICTSGAAARTSASTWLSNCTKLFWNIATSLRAVSSNSALFCQVLCG